MVTFNCEGLPGMGRTVQNIPDDCLAAKFYQAEVDATGLGKLAETAKVAQNYGLQYLAGTGDMDTVTVESLSDLDAEISNLIRLGEKVVLLGASAVIEPKIVSSDHADMNRKPLAITDEKPYWGTFPEKQFDGCGLIKIDPTFKVSFSYKMTTNKLLLGRRNFIRSIFRHFEVVVWQSRRLCKVFIAP